MCVGLSLGELVNKRDISGLGVAAKPSRIGPNQATASGDDDLIARIFRAIQDGPDDLHKRGHNPISVQVA